MLILEARNLAPSLIKLCFVFKDARLFIKFT